MLCWVVRGTSLVAGDALATRNNKAVSATPGLPVSADRVGGLSLLAKVPSAPAAMTLSSSVLHVFSQLPAVSTRAFFVAYHRVIGKMKGRRTGSPGSNSFIPTLPSFPGAPSWCSRGCPRAVRPTVLSLSRPMRPCTAPATSGYKSAPIGKHSAFCQ